MTGPCEIPAYNSWPVVSLCPGVRRFQDKELESPQQADELLTLADHCQWLLFFEKLCDSECFVPMRHQKATVECDMPETPMPLSHTASSFPSRKGISLTREQAS